MSCLTIRTAHPIFFECLIGEEFFGRACGTYGESRGVYGVVVGNPEVKKTLYDPGVDGRIILRWIFREWHARACVCSIGSGY